jgi:hypothetical protein
MNRFTAPKPFFDAAIAAFPSSCQALAADAAHKLAPIVDDAYRKRAVCLDVDGRNVYIPERLHFLCGKEIFEQPDQLPLIARCLLTRSTDGHLRQRALSNIVESQEKWAIPFIVILIGDYVVEVVTEILSAIPKLDRPAYRNFVLQNRPAMRALRAKATSYWNAYYRRTYPNPRAYPGLVVLHELETWAS